MAALALDAATERVAINLLRHLEWQADGFSLVFLFADVGPSIQLADWLNQRLVLNGRPLQRNTAKDDFVQQPEAAVDGLIELCRTSTAGAGALWYAVQRHPSDARWNQARRVFLARLNERRFLLERDMKSPLVLVLPADFRPAARNIAPDIWHVRALSEELRATAAVAGSPSAAQPPAVVAHPPSDARMPAYDEWRRMRTGELDEGSYLPTAWRAVEELLAAGRPGDAEDVARAVESLARQQSTTDGSTTSLRDLSIALDSVAAVAQERGDWGQAEAAYCEGLRLRRQLVERLGGTPESLRDLAISLNNVGRVARAGGDWSQAEAVIHEGLDLSRQLLERLGGTPQSLRDLSVSLDNVGQVAQARGDWGQAEVAYTEGLDLRRQLFERLARTPEALRDLSISLDNVGRVAQARGDWPQAEAAYREGLNLSRQLVERLGSTPESLRDLSSSLNNLGRVAQARREWGQAEVFYRESLDLTRQLVERLGGTPDGLRDLSISLDNVGRVARARSDWAQSEVVHRESLELRRQLVERLGSTPESLEDLVSSLKNLADLPSASASYMQEAIEIATTLAARFPDELRYRQWLTALNGGNQTPPSPEDTPHS